MLVGRFLGLHVHIKEGESTPKIIPILSIFQMQPEWGNVRRSKHVQTSEKNEVRQWVMKEMQRPLRAEPEHAATFSFHVSFAA